MTSSGLLKNVCLCLSLSLSLSPADGDENKEDIRWGSVSEHGGGGREAVLRTVWEGKLHGSLLLCRAALTAPALGRRDVC